MRLSSSSNLRLMLPGSLLLLLGSFWLPLSLFLLLLHLFDQVIFQFCVFLNIFAAFYPFGHTFLPMLPEQGISPKDIIAEQTFAPGKLTLMTSVRSKDFRLGQTTSLKFKWLPWSSNDFHEVQMTSTKFIWHLQKPCQSHLNEDTFKSQKGHQKPWNTAYFPPWWTWWTWSLSTSFLGNLIWHFEHGVQASFCMIFGWLTLMWATFCCASENSHEHAEHLEKSKFRHEQANLNTLKPNFLSPIFQV